MHKAEGVQPVDEEEDSRIRELYSHGMGCGLVDDNILMQKYIRDPLLIMGHKFDIRIHVLVASTNPLIVYFHDGFIRLSLHKYKKNSSDRKVLLTNYAVQSDLIKQAADGKKVLGMNE